jgi:hypothetical protein
MDHANIEAPPLVAELPTADEALRAAVSRCVLAVLNAVLRKGMPLDEVVARLNLVASVWEKERADG